ncbi:MAG: Cupin 2 conserved barrel domain protein [Firmicutes bacterium]|nr:Cupin 2 conserved barrel domain protein [Bacillota bacterium]
MIADILTAIEKGRVYGSSGEKDVNELPWQEHSSFFGVALKHLVTAENTGGAFSSHLVRVKRGCEIGKHIHEGKWELHEVIQGKGKCIIENKELDYYEGITAIIPPDIPHVVQATKEDVYILAKFVPALL